MVEQGHFASEDIKARLSSLHDHWNILKNKAAQRKQDLEDSLQVRNPLVTRYDIGTQVLLLVVDAGAFLYQTSSLISNLAFHIYVTPEAWSWIAMSSGLLKPTGYSISKQLLVGCCIDGLIT